MTKHYPKKHLLGQKIESWKGLLIFAFLNSSSSHKRENEKLCVLKCSKKLPREQRLDQLLHLSTVCLATVNCSILSAKPTAISTHFSLFQKRLYSEIPASGIKCFSAFGHWSVRRRLHISHAVRQRAQESRSKAFRSKHQKGGLGPQLCPGHPRQITADPPHPPRGEGCSGCVVLSNVPSFPRNPTTRSRRRSQRRTFPRQTQFEGRVDETKRVPS